MPSQTATLESPPSRPPSRVGRKPQVPPDLSRWAVTPARADYVTIPIAAAITGYSAKAIRRKIEAGVWLEGREFRRAPDGHVLISVKGYELWVERGSGVEVRGNSIRIQFTFNGEVLRRTLSVEGKPLPPTAANLKYAHRLAAEIRERIRFGSFSLAEYFPADGDVGQPMTVGTQLDDWLAAQRLEASTSAGYSSAIRFWKAAVCDRRGARLGDRPVRMLKHSDVLTALASRPTLSGKTVNNYVSVLRKAMELAVADKAIPTNPVSAVTRAKHQKPLPDPFSREEAESIVADMTAHYPAPIANYIEFKFFTGLRTSESFGLHWRDVDLAGKHLLVHRAIVRGVEKNNTKTNTARQVILNSRALAALKRQRKHTQMRDAHVFLDPRYGEPWLEERAFRRSYWEPTLRRLGMRYRPPYNTRHTYATMMLMAGMTPAFCAKQLGHSVEMFLRTYAKWIDGGQNALEMGRLEAALSPDGQQTQPGKIK